jgi:hypothetical protein
MDLNAPNKIIAHHFGGTDADPLADSSKQTAQDVDKWHSQRWKGFTSKVFKNHQGKFYHVGYHFVIERDGTVVQCRDYYEEGAHTFGQNKSSIGIALAGNFDVTKPTVKQLNAFKKVFKEINQRFPKITEKEIYPHRKFSSKTCYGTNLSDTFFTELLEEEYKSDQTVVRELQVQIVQLLNQLVGMLLDKRLSKRE